MTVQRETEDRDPVAADAARVRAEYARRASDEALRRYNDRVAPASLRAAADRQRRLLDVIDRVAPRADARVLEVGCGQGGDLAALVQLGVNEHRVAGIDLLEADISVAQSRLPNARVSVANAAALPFDAGSFDVVYQVVMLSSVVDSRVRAQIASEMRRVLAHSGRIVSYDMTYVGDGNPHLVPIDAGELARVFPGCPMTMERVTLQLPVASRVGPRVASVLERLPLLRRHLFAVIRTDT